MKLIYLKIKIIKSFFDSLTRRAILNCKPNTKFSSLPKNHETAYVFCATAKDSPPILKNDLLLILNQDL